MMNSYYDHGSAGFYNPAHQAAAAEAHHAAYRSFSQSLNLVPPVPTGYPSTRSSSSSGPSDSVTSYVDGPCKLYDGSTMSAQSSAFKECASKQENGFKMQEPSSNGNSDPLSVAAVVHGSAFGAHHVSPLTAASWYPPYHAHPQTRPDTTYLTPENDVHRTGFSDAYGSPRLGFGSEGNSVYHQPGSTSQSTASSGEFENIEI